MSNHSKKGISLVVLTVTILVLLILTSVTILNISNAGLKKNTEQTAFKNNIKNYLEELESWTSIERMKLRGNFDETKVKASNTVAYNGEYIQDIIKNISEDDIEKFEIIGGKLVYTGNGVTDSEELANETLWAEEAGIYLLSKALGEEDTIVFTDTEIGSAYDNIRIFGDSSNGTTGLSEISLTVTQNLIDNGFGEYKDTSNFTSKITNLPNQKVKGGVSAFYVQVGGYVNENSLGLIPVDTNKQYDISMYVKPNLDNQCMYSGVVEYDIDNKKVALSGYIKDTLTYLTEDLKDGDKEVHLADISNFTTNTTFTYQLGFTFWNYRDSTGYLYEPLTYSRNLWTNLYTVDGIDKENNTITLKNEWNKGTIEAGTKLSQSNAGITYNYSLLSTKSLNAEWKYTHNTIKDVAPNLGSNMRFRCGTRSVTWFIQSNAEYLSGGGATFANVIFAESDKYNKQYTIDMTGHDPLRTMEDGTSDYIDYKNKRIVRCVGISGSTLYKLSSEKYESITLPTLPIYEGNTAITLNQTGRLEGTYIK